VDDKNAVGRSQLEARLKDAGFPVRGQETSVKGTSGGDVLMVDKPPQDPSKLAVWGKATVVAVCTPDCPPCDIFKKDIALFAERVSKVAVRIVVMDSPEHVAAQYIPKQADIPYILVYDQAAQQKYAGGHTGEVVYKTVETILGVTK
jgi:thiol-disulfide isomerase/thioredoxin